MAYSDFLRRYAAYKHVVDIEEMQKSPEHRYAVRCRERGRVYVSRMKNLLRPSFEDIRLLDVGCAYGGVCIELALAGAKTAGAEVIPSYVDLATSNAAGDVSVEFFLGDLTLKSTMETIRSGKIGKFNAFIINHALEHIYDTEGLLQSLDKLAERDAVILFDVPNGFSVQSYYAEGHTGVFGVSVADPDTWHYFGNERARIYYRRLEYFRALFAWHGYRVSLVRPELASRHAMEERLRQAVRESQEKAKASIAPKNVISEAVERFESEVAFDLRNATDGELDLKYFHYFWRGIAYRRAEVVAEEFLERIPFPVWGQD